MSISLIVVTFAAYSESHDFTYDGCHDMRRNQRARG